MIGERESKMDDKLHIHLSSLFARTLSTIVALLSHE